jgi:hypothetical protein
LALNENDQELGPVLRFSHVFHRCAAECRDADAKPLFREMAANFRLAVLSALRGDFKKAADPKAAVKTALEDVTAPMEDIYDVARENKAVFALWDDVNKSIRHFGARVVNSLTSLDDQPEDQIRLLNQSVLRLSL